MIGYEIDARTRTFVRYLRRADFVKTRKDEGWQYIPSRIGPLITRVGDGTSDRKRNDEGEFLQSTQQIESKQCGRSRLYGQENYVSTAADEKW
jgi:hypothetical protein